VTLLSPPQCRAAFGTMPHTLASVDPSPVCRPRTLPPSGTRTPRAGFWRGDQQVNSRVFCSLIFILSDEHYSKMYLAETRVLKRETEFIWLRLRADGGLLKHGNESSGSIKGAELIDSLTGTPGFSRMSSLHSVTCQISMTIGSDSLMIHL
jgi:hypothetical protein